MNKRMNLMVLAATILFTTSVPALAQDAPRVVTIPGSGFVMVDGVNVRNGNFAISYNYYTKDGGIPFDMTYNSRSTQDGWFGRGWGTPFEARMLMMPDGSAIIHENGTGAYTLYGEPSDAAIRAEVEQIVAAAMRANPKLDVATYRKTLLGSRGARFDAVKAYGLQGTFPPSRSLPVYLPSTFVGGACESDKLVRPGNMEGVIRATCKEGRADAFDIQGHITAQLYRRLGAMLVYDNIGDTVKSIAIADQDLHPLGIGLTFSWNGKHVARLEDENAHPMTFDYDTRGNLIKAEDPSDNTYYYSYDAHNNMTDIRYIDDSHKRITYDADDRVTSIADREGNVTTYEYQRDFSNPKISLTRVTQKKASGTAVTIYRMTDE
jgi:YD repeat-containing protein